MALSSPFSSSHNWVYDVFRSFSGEDVRVTFLSHFLKELDRKLISAFKDNEIKRSHSIGPELKQAIRHSRIAVVVFSKNYASSSWCLDELVEILKCKSELGQMVIPIFYGLDPSHVRKQTGEFGKIFEKTSKTKANDEIQLWLKALTDVANIRGYHSRNCDNEAKMIEEIADDVLGKLNLTPPKEFEDFLGIEDHISHMSLLLRLDLEEVRMVGIWGPSGIGKTIIARTLFSQLRRHFQGSVFIDKAFVSKSMEIFGRANPDDYNMKLHLQESFLSKVLGKKDLKIENLGAAGERLKHHKVLIFIDDLDDQVVLNTLAGQSKWFGRGSRIIVITKDKHLLRAHGIDCIYEVGLPHKKLALEMFSHSAFRQNYPPDGFIKLASEVVERVGCLPLGLNVLGSYLRGKEKEDWMDMLPRLCKDLDGKIENTLKVSYDGLDSKDDKSIFRHIACLFNHTKINDIKLLLAESDLDVKIRLKTLNDKSLIHITWNTVEMHRLLQDMGEKIVRMQSTEPGKREFLVDSKDIRDVLGHSTGTGSILGISLDIDEIDETDELHVHEEAFKMMDNLRFLKIYRNQRMSEKEVKWNLPEDIKYFPPKLRLLSWYKYPMRLLPSNFRLENLVKLKMQESKLEKLWEGVRSLPCLKDMDLSRSKNLKKIPDLSMATNLETLDLKCCLSLVELPSSIRNLNKLTKLNMSGCRKLKSLPTRINLKSLHRLDLSGCSRLRSFPDFSNNISDLFLDETSIEEFPSKLRLKNLVDLSMRGIKSGTLWEGVQPLDPMLMMTLLSTNFKVLFLSDIPSLVELPSSMRHLTKLTLLSITNCINLEILPTNINLESLNLLTLTECPRLKSFPNISTNVSSLFLDLTGIEEVPWWIETFSRLFRLHMNGCQKLRSVSLNISKLKHLEEVEFSGCGALTEARWRDHLYLGEASYYRLRNYFVSKAVFRFFKCLNLDQEDLIQQEPVFKLLILHGRNIPSYFTHQSTGTSLTNIPLLHTFLRFRACVVLDVKLFSTFGIHQVDIQVFCQDRLGNYFDSLDQPHCYSTTQIDSHLVIFDCCFRLNEENASLAELGNGHLDIHFHLTDVYSPFKMKGCGIRLFEDFSNTLPRIWEEDDEKIDGGNASEGSSGERDVETKRSNKRMRIT